MNRSAAPDAIADITVPTPGKRKLDGSSGPVREGRGRELVNAIGLDGETVKYVIGSVASASSSAAAAAGGIIYTRGYEGLKLEHGVHNARLLGGAAVSGAGLVFNAAASTARATASGTGAVLNFAADRLLPAPLSEEEYRQMQAHEARVAEDHAFMSAQAKIHQNALIAQEKSRIAEQEENQRNAEAAMALVQQQELDFQDARSIASSAVRAKHGAGRRGNVTRALQGRPPAREQMVRNEQEGIGAKMIRGGKSIMNAVDGAMIPSHLRAQGVGYF
jgi:hypothetical protein